MNEEHLQLFQKFYTLEEIRWPKLETCRYRTLIEGIYTQYYNIFQSNNPFPIS